MIWYWLLLGAAVAATVGARRAGVLDIAPGHTRTAWLATGLVVFFGSWMGFDGGRALLVGDYVTPGGSGQLGPWADVVHAVGVDPRSTLMKLTLLTYGVASITAAFAFLTDRPRGWHTLVVVTVLGLWYLPFGTVLGVTALALLVRVRPHRT